MITCEQAALLLSARLDGELTQAEAAALEEHLAQCPECRAIAAQLEELHAAMADLKDVPAPADFTRRVMDSLGEQEKPRKVIPLFRRPQFKAITGLAACALLCVGLYNAHNRQSIQPATFSIGVDPAASSDAAPQTVEPMGPKTVPGENEVPENPAPPAEQKRPEAPVDRKAVPGSLEGNAGTTEPQTVTPATTYGVKTNPKSSKSEDYYNAVSREGGALLALHIPEGWTVESVRGQERTGFRFRPQDRTGFVYLCCYEKPVGQCGTGLVTEQLEFPSGRTWTVGTYDGHAMWDFLYPGTEPGPFQAEIEPEAADWWEEFKGEALEILDSARLEQK